jgi:hypothetical protein
MIVLGRRICHALCHADDMRMDIRMTYGYHTVHKVSDNSSFREKS